MRYNLDDLPALLRSPLGRLQILHGGYDRSWPILSRAAALCRRTLGRNANVVAVVGTYGKTTTARAVVAVLGLPIERPYQWNFRAYVASALLRAAFEHRAVIEVGIDRPGQMSTCANILRPRLVVVTSIGSEHHSTLRTLEVTRHEKAEMVRSLAVNGMAVLNGDDPNVRWMSTQTRGRVLTFGFDTVNDVWASDVVLDWPNGTLFTLHAGGAARKMRVRLIGRYMVYPILAAVAVGMAEDLDLERVIGALEVLPSTPGRMEAIPLANGAIILRDEFKSHYETVVAALNVLAEIPARRRIAVMGEVEEPPLHPHQVNREIGGLVARAKARLVFVGQSTSFNDYVVGAKRAGQARNELDAAGRDVLKATAMVQADLGPGDVVLIKGRMTQRLDRIALVLEGRKVRCGIVLCDTRVTRCDGCPMLERGWDGLRVVI